MAMAVHGTGCTDAAINAPEWVYQYSYDFTETLKILCILDEYEDFVMAAAADTCVQHARVRVRV